jgi:hypothetical protein
MWQQKAFRRTWPSNTSDKVSGLDTYYQGFGNSGYAHASDEYTGPNGQVTSTVSYAGHHVDSTTASGGGNTSAILADVCKVVGTGAAHDGFYPVYVDLPIHLAHPSRPDWRDSTSSRTRKWVPLASSVP